MGDRTAGDVRTAVSLFADVKKTVEDQLGVSSAADLVNRVVRGVTPRRGTLSGGEEYLVHGIGYTVTLIAGPEVHIDSCGDFDCFKTYDIRMYFEGIEVDVPSLEDIALACGEMVAEGKLRRIDAATFAFS